MDRTRASRMYFFFNQSNLVVKLGAFFFGKQENVKKYLKNYVTKVERREAVPHSQNLKL